MNIQAPVVMGARSSQVSSSGSLTPGLHHLSSAGLKGREPLRAIVLNCRDVACFRIPQRDLRR